MATSQKWMDIGWSLSHISEGIVLNILFDANAISYQRFITNICAISFDLSNYVVSGSILIRIVYLLLSRNTNVKCQNMK